MHKINLGLFVSTLLLGAVTFSSAANLQDIKVYSSTIDDRFESTKSEVSSVSMLSGDQVDQAHVENIHQVLQGIPGITTEVQSGDSLKIHIRGLENQMYMGEKPGVAVVIDGVPVFERTGRVNIDLDNIESIKVIKGGASYLFGDDALSGAVIITTKRGAKYDHNLVSVESGSHGYQKVLARTGYSSDAMSFHIQASERKGDGYHEGSGYNAQYLNGKLQYYLDEMSDITFGLELSDREKDSHGTVGGITEAENNPESIYTGDQESRDYTRGYDVNLGKFFTTYARDFEDGSNLLLNAYLYTDDTEYLSAPQKKDENGVAQASFDDNDYLYTNAYAQIQRGIKSEYRTSLENFATLIGIDLRSNRYENSSFYRVDQALFDYKTKTTTASFFKAGDPKSDSKTNEKVLALYGESTYALTSSLQVTANLRHDTIKLDYSDYLNNSFDNAFNVYSGRVGANYLLAENTYLYANCSTGFRAPTVQQLYAGDVSTWGSTLNNPDLKPEHSYNYEIGLRSKNSGISYDLSLFQLDRRDFIMKTSGNYGDTDTSDIWDNVGGARHRGIEFAAAGTPVKDLSLNLAYTYLNAEYTDYDTFGMTLGSGWGAAVVNYDVTGNEIPRTPSHRLNVIAEYKVLDQLKVTTEVNAKSKYYADDLNQLEIDGHTTLNLMVNYVTTVSNTPLDLFIRVDNLFDKQYYNTARSSGDRDENGVFDYEDLSITVNPGRVLTAGLSAKF